MAEICFICFIRYIAKKIKISKKKISLIFITVFEPSKNVIVSIPVGEENEGC